MTGSVEQVAAIALTLPETAQGRHFDIPDFRVRGKIFCTARANEPLAMVKLPQEIQTTVMLRYPDAISPAAGAWGRGGSTLVRVDLVPPEVLADLIVSAWRDVAPPKLVAAYLADQEGPG
jgi:hypothetical protein